MDHNPPDSDELQNDCQFTPGLIMRTIMRFDACNPITPTTMDQRLKIYLTDQARAMFDLLARLVAINSGSFNKAGVDAVGGVIAEAVSDCGLEVTTVEETRAGNHLVIRNPSFSGAAGQVLLVGHMDTVFAEDTYFTDYREDGNRAFGPGVIDMKGGLVAGIYALKALSAVGLLSRIPLVFICNSDEEIGSVHSRPLILREAAHSDCAFVLECAGLDGAVVTARKGNLSAKLIVSGQAGHAAYAGADKASAILEMAHKIVAIEALNDPSKEISANAGTVHGGIGPNTVADRAESRLDFRFTTPEEGQRLKSRLDVISAGVIVPGTMTELEVISGRPPMPDCPANRNLYARVAAVAVRLGIPVRAEFRSGVSDANVIAQTGTPVIDGMGPIGGGDHSPDEYLIKPSLPQRTLLLASVLAELAK